VEKVPKKPTLKQAMLNISEGATVKPQVGYPLASSEVVALLEEPSLSFVAPEAMVPVVMEPASQSLANTSTAATVKGTATATAKRSMMVLATATTGGAFDMLPVVINSSRSLMGSGMTPFGAMDFSIVHARLGKMHEVLVPSAFVIM
jgi:hypothetical protein